METMVLCMLAFLALVAAGSCLYCNRPLAGLAACFGAMVFLWLTGRSWLFMLIDSGKDTAFLGFHRYPAAPVILLVLAVLSVCGMILSIVKLARKKQCKKI